MGNRITQLGLEHTARRISGLVPSTFIQTMMWDNATGAANAITAAHQAANSPGAIVALWNATTNTISTASATPVVSYIGTLTTAQFNGNTIGRITLHLAATAAVTTASTFLYGGIDQQTIAKTSEYSLVTQIDVTHVSTSI